MRLILFLISFLPLATIAQTYTMSNAAAVNTCSGNFYDSGGAGLAGAARYANNENFTRTFCSSSANCIQINFTTLDIESGYDFLYIYDGPSIASPLIATLTGTAAPGLITSTSGCITLRFTSDGTTRAGGWVAAISCVTCPVQANYLHPTVGIAGEYVGTCLVSNCGPFTYADNGGVGAPYSLNIDQIYRTFCPSIAGNCMQVTFNSFNVEAGYDFLQVNNGPTQNSPTFTTAPSGPTAYVGITGLTGNLAAPFSYTSTDASGCLTFRFYSDNIVTGPGWNATLQCVPCAGGPTGTTNSDCQNMTAVCSNSPISSSASGPGIVAEGCSGSACPAGGENHSNWYTFTAQTTGTLSLNVSPATALDDYDFAIYGPNASCGALGSPLRCSDAGTSGNTGATGTTGAANTDASESVTGNGVVGILNVVAGQSYILVVDKWSPAGTSGYTLSFGGTASLDCTILPIELSEFNAIYQPDLDLVDLNWITETEMNSDYFDVEKSTDGINFRKIAKIKAAGNSTMETQYMTVDNDPVVGVNYYRLNQFDIDGESKYSEIRAVNILADMYDMLTAFPNPTTGMTEIVFNSYTKEEVILNVTSYSGQTVVNAPLSAKNGGNHVDLDLSNEANGIYFITVTTKDKVYKTKLIKN